MKIGIIGDTHFGYPRFEEDALKQGSEAIVSASGKCDALILAGDIFDTRVPKPETLAEAVKLLRNVRIPVYAIHGTHERRSRGMVNPIEMLETAGFLKNVHGKTEIFGKNSEKVAITGLGGVPDDLAKAALETLEPKPEKGAFNIFVLHQSLSEFIFAKPEMLSMGDLPSGFDLYVCGHMHKHTIANNGKLLIPGSTVVTQMREDEMGDKGYYIYDTEKRSAEFVAIKARRFFFKDLKFDKAGMERVRSECSDYIKKCISEAGGKPIIRIKLSGSLAPGVSASDLSMSPLAANDWAFVQIDNFFEEASLTEKIGRIRDMREKKASVRDMGMEILRERLRANSGNVEDAENLFTSLSEGPEGALAEIERKVREKSEKR